jgi:hypothetical protein
MNEFFLKFNISTPHLVFTSSFFHKASRMTMTLFKLFLATFRTGFQANQAIPSTDPSLIYIYLAFQIIL